MTQTKRKYEYISADSHLEVPAERWSHWIPEEYREWAPQKQKQGSAMKNAVKRVKASYGGSASC